MPTLTATPQQLEDFATERAFPLQRSGADIAIAPAPVPDAGTIWFRFTSADQCTVELSAPSTPTRIDAQRWRHRVLVALGGLSLALGGSARQALTRVFENAAKASADPSKWVSAWTKTQASPELILGSGARVPMLIRIHHERPIHANELALFAAASCAPRRRQWAAGLTENQREKNRMVFSKRPSLLLQDGDANPLPVLRYSLSPETNDSQAYSTTLKDPTFWECIVRPATEQTAGFTGTSIEISELSRTSDILAYGGELLHFLQALKATIEGTREVSRTDALAIVVP